jgi:DNA mismatch repair protein MutS
MFAAAENDPEPKLHPVVSELETIEPDELTPKQALDMLYRLKQLARG